jgi:DNA-directed RNA polymerase I, II, and III subunit RPABC1
MADSEIQMSLDEFQDMATGGQGVIDHQRLNFFARLANDDTQRIFVYWTNETSVGVAAMRKFLQQLEDQDIHRGIIIYPEKMTASAHKVIEAMRSNYDLEDFSQVSLLVNITHHHLVPKHEVLTDDEKRALLDRYRLKETQLPRIQIGDPVARYYGMKRGQVCKITRRRWTAYS